MLKHFWSSKSTSVFGSWIVSLISSHWIQIVLGTESSASDVFAFNVNSSVTDPLVLYCIRIMELVKMFSRITLRSFVRENWCRKIAEKDGEVGSHY